MLFRHTRQSLTYQCLYPQRGMYTLSQASMFAPCFLLANCVTMVTRSCSTRRLCMYYPRANAFCKARDHPVQNCGMYTRPRYPHRLIRLQAVPQISRPPRPLQYRKSPHRLLRLQGEPQISEPPCPQQYQKQMTHIMQPPLHQPQKHAN